MKTERIDKKIPEMMNDKTNNEDSEFKKIDMNQKKDKKNTIPKNINKVVNFKKKKPKPFSKLTKMQQNIISFSVSLEKSFIQIITILNSSLDKIKKTEEEVKTLKLWNKDIELLFSEMYDVINKNIKTYTIYKNKLKKQQEKIIKHKKDRKIVNMMNSYLDENDVSVEKNQKKLTDLMNELFAFDNEIKDTTGVITFEQEKDPEDKNIDSENDTLEATKNQSIKDNEIKTEIKNEK